MSLENRSQGRAGETRLPVPPVRGFFKVIPAPRRVPRALSAFGIHTYLAGRCDELVRTCISILNGPLFGQLELRMLRATRFVNVTESNYMNLLSQRLRGISFVDL